MYANLDEKPLEIPQVDYAALQSRRASEVEAFCKEAGGGGDALKSLTGAATADAADKAVAAAKAGASLGALMKALASGETTAAPLSVHRGAEPFEQLRAAMDRHIQATGERVKIFLANMGPIPQHKARADFSAGFFQPGGFDMLGNSGFAAEDECAEAFVQSGAKIAVICSTDKAYPEMVPVLARLLKEKVPGACVILAGKPAKDLEQTYRDAGMDDYIFLGADCHAMLLNLQKRSGLTHE